MIDTIIFMDNLFKMAYGSVTRNSRGRQLAELGSNSPADVRRMHRTKDSESRNSGVDYPKIPAMAGMDVALAPFLAFRMFPFAAMNQVRPR
jgi:hypothetical protein